MPPQFLPHNTPNILHTHQDRIPSVPQKRANPFASDTEVEFTPEATGIHHRSSNEHAMNMDATVLHQKKNHQCNERMAEDYRREVNYTDRGERQDITPFGLTRAEMNSIIIPLPPADADALFIPDTSLPLYDQLPELPNASEELPELDDVPPEPENYVDEESTDCVCPISYECAERAVDRTDCRPLVPPAFKKFIDRMDEESYEIQKAASPSYSGNFATANRLADIISYLDTVDGLQNVSMATKRSAHRNAYEWVHEMKGYDIKPEDLQSSQIIPRLRDFLGADNAANREAQAVGDWLFEELKILFKRWVKGDLLCDQNRGLTPTGVYDVNATLTKSGFKLDKDYQFYRSPNVYGHNGLVNGQLWYSRLQLMRDGGHGSKIGGISGNLVDGAYSVVMGLHTKDSKYADVDMLEVVEYEGTALPDTSLTRESNRQDDQDERCTLTAADATRATRVLMRSIKSKRPVRLFRSYKLSDKVINKPIQGYRYDGLYTVISKRCQNRARQIWSFRMERISGQGQLRGVRPGDPSRPSNGVRKAWNDHRQ